MTRAGCYCDAGSVWVGRDFEVRFAGFREGLEVVGERHVDYGVLLVQVAGFHVRWVFGVAGRLDLHIVIKMMVDRRGWRWA